MKNIFIKTRLSLISLSAVFIFATFSKSSIAAEASFYEALAQFVRVIYENAETSNKGDKICIYGSDNVSINIVGGDIVVLEDSNDKNKNKKCRIIYVAKDKERLVKSFIDNLNKSGALTVATFSNFVNDGGMVFVDIGRRNFELTVNIPSFKASGVKLDSAITGLIINTKN